MNKLQEVIAKPEADRDCNALKEKLLPKDSDDDDVWDEISCRAQERIIGPDQ